MIRFNTFLGVYECRKGYSYQWYEITENMANILFQEGYYHV